MIAHRNGVEPEITSVSNPIVVAALKLQRTRQRWIRGRTLLEGPHLLAALVASGSRPEIVLSLPLDQKTRDLCIGHEIESRTISEEVLSRLAPTEHPRGPIAVIAVPEGGRLAAVDTIVLLGVADPGNAGTLVRSAAAFGFRVAVGRETVDIWAPKVLRAGAGAHFSVGFSVLGADPVAELSAAGLVVAATATGGAGAPGKWDDRAIALMIGNEPRGLANDVVAGADVVVNIPTTGGIESLNAAIAGSILMYERARTRNRVGS